MTYSARVCSLLAAIVVVGTVAACGSDSGDANATLPPIATTTTTTTLPPTTTTVPDFYIVQKGETLFAIAQKFGITYLDLAAYNNIPNPDDVPAGMKLRIPKAGEAIPTTVAATTVATSSP